MTVVKTRLNWSAHSSHWAAAFVGSVLLAACSTASGPPGAVAGSTSSGGSRGCAETQPCERTAHWDAIACACLPNSAQGGAGNSAQGGAGNSAQGGAGGESGGAASGGTIGCVDKAQCARGSHWDESACKCMPTVPGCSADADCHGPLPQICRICSDGSTGCARHQCIAGKCQIVTCSAALAP